MSKLTAINQANDKDLPDNIMLDKWADIGFVWQGVLPLAAFHRLSAQAVASADVSELTVKLSLAKTEGILWLDFIVEGTVPVMCQRCLEPLAIDVSGDYRMALLYSEDEIGRVDGEEFVLIDEVLGAENRRMLPIKDLLEDELLLALPLSPRHDDCDMYVDSAGDEIDETEEEKENPFAALAALKGKLS